MEVCWIEMLLTEPSFAPIVPFFLFLCCWNKNSQQCHMTHTLAFMASSSAFLDPGMKPDYMHWRSPHQWCHVQPQDPLGHPVAVMAPFTATTSLGAKGTISLCLSCKQTGKRTVEREMFWLGLAAPADVGWSGTFNSSPNTENCHSQAQEWLRRTESKALKWSSNFIGFNSIKHSGNSKEPQDIFPVPDYICHLPLRCC